MAVNPMQRKAKNSFLLGFLICLIISGLIIAFLVIQLGKIKSEQEAQLATITTAYVANRQIKSGETIKPEDIQMVQVSKDAIPSNMISGSSEFEEIVQNAETGEESILNLKNAKINIEAGTIITTDMLIDTSVEDTRNLRTVEYNMIALPTQIEDQEYVDVRLQLPNGLDYLVVSKKQITIPMIGGVPSESSIWLQLREEEILLMSNAIVESYIVPGAKLYVTRYVEPGLQDAATPTYIPSNEVIGAINRDPNIIQKAKEELSARQATSGDNRQDIQNQVNANAEDAQDNVEAAVQEELKVQQDERVRYLEAMGAGV